MEKSFRFLVAVLLLIIVVAACGRTSVKAVSKCQGGICYEIRDGYAIAEGDVILGLPEDVETRLTRRARQGVALPWPVYRWPNGKIPYVIASTLPDPQRVKDAIEYYHRFTNIRFVKRTTHKAYVVFRPWHGGYCRSWIGRTGSAQSIDLDAACATKWIIHEIGHAVGLWHEHTREDRDKYVKILWDDILPGMEGNFQKHITDGDDIGRYDFASMMHYPPFGFSKNGKPTITRKDGSTAGFGDFSGLSAGDIATLKKLYPPPPGNP